MAQNPDEEIDDADADKEIDSEEEEDADAESEEESEDEEEDEESEDDDDDESDSDDDDSKPLTRGELMKILSKRGKNRSAAAARTSGKRELSGSRSPKGEERIASVEQSVQRIEQLETKRAFGYENNLAPDEVDVVFRLVKKPRSKDLSDPVVKGALEGYRTAKRAKNNTPSSSGRPARVSSKEEKNMTPADRKDRFQDRRRQILVGKQK